MLTSYNHVDPADIIKMEKKKDLTPGWWAEPHSLPSTILGYFCVS